MKERQAKSIEVVKKKPFLGKKITPENRNRVKDFFYTIFMQKVALDEHYADLDHDQKVKVAKLYASLEVDREKAHYKAWLKSKPIYKFHGQIYPVLTEVVEDQSTYLSDVLDLEPFLGEEE